MSAVTIKVRANGPFLIEGPITLIDYEGNAFPLNSDKPNVAFAAVASPHADHSATAHIIDVASSLLNWRRSQRVKGNVSLANPCGPRSKSVVSE